MVPALVGDAPIDACHRRSQRHEIVHEVPAAAAVRSQHVESDADLLLLTAAASAVIDDFAATV